MTQNIPVTKDLYFLNYKINAAAIAVFSITWHYFVLNIFQNNRLYRWSMRVMWLQMFYIQLRMCVYVIYYNFFVCYWHIVISFLHYYTIRVQAPEAPSSTSTSSKITNECLQN